MSEQRISIVMGSDSDLPVMRAAPDFLKEYGLDFEVRVLSAHRTPEAAVRYAQEARNKGIGVIIAGAGGAAHLPGVIAALTTLPVIGVPIQTAALGGTDSLYSIVQMPSGIPVATVGINAAKNAAILAMRILGTSDAKIEAQLQEYRKSLEAGVKAKADRLAELGYEKYTK